MQVNYHIYKRSRLDKFSGEFMGKYFFSGVSREVYIKLLCNHFKEKGYADQHAYVAPSWRGMQN